jgi:transcriptional antiterminator
LWYLNPELDPDRFKQLAYVLSTKENGFTTFSISDSILEKIIHDVFMADLEEPPSNRLRKIIFNPTCGLTSEQKLKIVGKLSGKTKKVDKDDLYQSMLDINDMGKKITIGYLAKLLNCSSRTIHRYMCNELKREKELLNQEL